MKKTLLSAALALAVAGSWAFYPKTAEPNGYMMLVSRFSGTAFSAKLTLSTISPDGQVQTQDIDAKTGTVSKVTSSFDLLHLNELKKLNELQQNGWRVVTSTQSNAPVLIETTYLLEKR